MHSAYWVSHLCCAEFSFGVATGLADVMPRKAFLQFFRISFMCGEAVLYSPDQFGSHIFTLFTFINFFIFNWEEEK